MTMRRMLIAGTAIAMLGSAPALAETMEKKADATETTASDATILTILVADTDPAILDLPFHDVDGMDVHSITGEEIGELEGLYRGIDGKVYARMNIGGDWFDVVKEEVAVPLSAFRMEGDELRLPITEAEAEALEEWSEGDYEQMAEDLGNEGLAEVYGD